ncbi:ABC transporter permease [Actinocatenispora comari]|uniref:ABC transporter permease n=1 Tax=Actinocatenispora comari TaxID=2807577 RepID=A0A8J4AHU6_9ACTN|nr:FtsX-like permease family protein [Actinocatenispora comari]GIL31796.1 ABC transporter permease [Actinocatenispora comari]
MRTLAFASVRHRLGGFVGSLLAVLLTVGLLTVSGLLMFSALTAGPGPDRFAAATAVVAKQRSVTLRTVTHKKDKTKVKSKTKPLTGAAVLPAGLARRLAGTEGVAGTVADTAFPVDLAVAGRPVRGPHGSAVVAHGWSSAALTPYRLRAGTAPARGGVVLDASFGARPGERVTVATKTGTHRLRVTGIAAPRGADALANQGAVFVADDAVAALSGLAGPTAVAVRAAPGVSADTLARRLGHRVPHGLSVFTGDERIAADLPGATISYVGAVSVFGIMLGVTGFTAVFVLVGAISLVARRRLRELALLRTVGATPAQLRRLLGAETALVALLAGVPGAVCGALAADAVAQRFRDAGVVPAQFPVRINVGVLLAAVAAGIAISVLSGALAARRATTIAPTEALRETVTAPAGGIAVRIVAAVVTAAGAAGVLVFVPLRSNLGIGMSFVAAALLMCAVAAAGPLLARLLGAALGAVFGRGGATGRLAAATTRTQARRVAAVALPLALMVAITVTLLGTSTLTGQVAQHQQAQRSAGADWQLAQRTGSGVPLGVAERLAGLPGATGVAATLPSTIMIDDHGKPEHHSAQGLYSAGTPALRLGVTAGRLGTGMAVGADLAAGQGWHVGDRVRIWLADASTASLRIDAVYQRVAGFGEVVLPAKLVAAHDPRGLVGAMYLRGDAGLAATVTHRYPQLTVIAAQRTVAVPGIETQQAAFDALTVILLGFIAISVANTFAMAALGRRREFADLRLAGATARQVHTLAVRETLIAVCLGLLLGCAVTAAVVGAYGLAQDARWHLVVDPAGYAAVIGGTGLLGLVAGIVPTRLLVRRRALPAA